MNQTSVESRSVVIRQSGEVSFCVCAHLPGEVETCRAPRPLKGRRKAHKDCLEFGHLRSCCEGMLLLGKRRGKDNQLEQDGGAQCSVCEFMDLTLTSMLGDRLKESYAKKKVAWYLIIILIIFFTNAYFHYW